MSWIEIKLNLSQTLLEEISGYLFAQGCEGINIKEDGIFGYFNRHRWSEEIKLGIVHYIQDIVPSFGLRDMKIVNVSEQDWNKSWKEFFKPILVSSRVVVKPPWEEYRERGGEIILTINPQMAFGTGHHESTKLVIRALEKWLKPHMSVLDVGTGSGILAVLADKLGADSVVAIDNDPVALKNAYENAQLNDTSTNVRFYLAQAEVIHQSEYDLVLANINRNVLIKYAEIFSGVLKNEGKCILSGLLRQDEKIITEVYQKAGFSLLEKNNLKDWLSIVFQMSKKVSGYEKSSN